MRRKIWVAVSLVIGAILLAACGDDDNEVSEDDLKMMDVEFDPPEEADVGETIELEAIVTYGDEKVTDAQDMQFEYWKAGEREDNTFENGENHEDGSYSIEVEFDEDGVYEVYAHTTAEGMHKMPKHYIAVGDATEEDVEEAIESDEDDDKGGMDELEMDDDNDDNGDNDSDNDNNAENENND